MAGTPAGTQLTERHRRLQLRLRAITIAELLRLWPTLDFDDIDRSWQALEPTIATLVQARRRQSAGLSSRYYTAFRMVEGVDGIVTPVLAPPVRAETLLSSLRVTGPVAFKRAIDHGRDAQEASRVALTMLSGSTTRHVLNGSRETLLGTVQTDRAARGWYRQTGPKPCSFCAMLAARGAIYRTEASGGFHPHDNCGCMPVPMYQPGTVAQANRDLGELWDSSTRGVRGGKQQRLAFRRAYEGRT